MKETMTYKLETNVYTDPVILTTTKGRTGILFGIAESIADHFQVDSTAEPVWSEEDKNDLVSLSITGIDGDGDDFTLTITKEK